MAFSTTLLLSKSDVRSLITLREAIKAVEDVFRAFAENRIVLPSIIHADVARGEFHIKARGYRDESSPYFTTKINGGFFSNETDYHLSSIQGLIVLNHTQNGYPLAIMDSSVITAMRTAAAMAVAAKYLAHPQATTATLCGCGKQAAWQLRALKEVMPLFQTTFVYSRSFEKSAAFSEAMAQELHLKVIPVKDLKAALQTSQICITCTPSKHYFLEKEMLPPDLFIAAMGADSPDKQEIDPSIFKDAKIVVDARSQCETVGELHHALQAGFVDKNKPIIELGTMLSNNFQLRENAEEIILFDSTGTAMQDTALAYLAYEKAIKAGMGQHFPFF